MADRLARHRVAYGAAVHRRVEGMKALDAIRDTISSITTGSSGLSQRQATIGDLNSRLRLVQGVIADIRQRYENDRRLLVDLIPDLDAFTAEQDARERSLSQLRELSLKRERLIRSTETLRGTYRRFAALAEEARIASQVASSDLRVITRAVRIAGEGSDPLKSAVLAGVVALVVSVFAALLLDYWKREHREEPTEDAVA